MQYTPELRSSFACTSVEARMVNSGCNWTRLLADSGFSSAKMLSENELLWGKKYHNRLKLNHFLAILLKKVRHLYLLSGVVKTLGDQIIDEDFN